MSLLKPFSLRIFVADGDPDGLRLVERSNWVGKAIVFPRALLPKIKQRAELNQTGVYLLLGPREDGEGEMLYIGEGDPVRPRLESHYAQKDFWNRAVCFVAAPGQLNKAHVQFLEANLVRLAKAAKRLPLDNANHPAEPSLSEADCADMQVFLENMLGMLPVLGIHAFEQAAPLAATVAQTVLTCRGKGVSPLGLSGLCATVNASTSAQRSVNICCVALASHCEVNWMIVCGIWQGIWRWRRDG
ncbi:MAG: GIY-YIG nuclease family protein [Thiobacillus sp.]